MLTSTEQQAILADFKEWSGGFVPGAVELPELITYIAAGADASFSNHDLCQFLAAEYNRDTLEAAISPEDLRRKVQSKNRQYNPPPLPECGPRQFLRLLEHYTFATTCVSADCPSLDTMWETAEEITYRQFAQELGEQEIAQLNRHMHPPPSKEPYISFHRALFRGKPALVMTHSAINHIWCK